MTDSNPSLDASDQETDNNPQIGLDLEGAENPPSELTPEQREDMRRAYMAMLAGTVETLPDTSLQAACDGLDHIVKVLRVQGLTPMQVYMTLGVALGRGICATNTPEDAMMAASATMFALQTIMAPGSMDNNQEEKSE